MLRKNGIKNYIGLEFIFGKDYLNYDPNENAVFKIVELYNRAFKVTIDFKVPNEANDIDG